MTVRDSHHARTPDDDLVTSAAIWIGGPLVAAAALVLGICWAAAAVTQVASGHRRPSLPAGRLPGFAGSLVTTGDPVLAASRVGVGTLGSPVVFWLAFGLLLGCAAGLTVVITARLLHRADHRRPGRGATWGDRTVERTMSVPDDPAQRPGRLVAGRGTLTGRLLAADDCISALVFGPNGSGKSTGLIAPNVLEWHGPLVMTTTKAAAVAAIHARRVALGPVWVVAPGGCPGLPTSGWSPVDYATDEESADRVAEWLCEASGLSGDPRARAWIVQARKLIKPLLLAAHLSGTGIDGFVSWVYDGRAASEQVRAILLGAGFGRVAREYESTWSIHSEGVGSVLFTAFGLADAYSRPAIRETALRGGVDVPRLVQDGSPATLIIVAPESEAERFAPLVTALLASVVHSAENRAAQLGGPLQPRLLMALGEAGNVFRFPRLANLLTTARGNGIQLLLVYHDLAQLEQVVGRQNARTVISNAKLRMLLPGVGDVDTLRYFTDILGRAQVDRSSRTRTRGGQVSTSTGPQAEDLAPLHSLQQLPAAHAVVQYQNLAPLRVRLRLSYADPALVRISADARAAPGRA